MPITAATLVAELDQAGVGRGVVLSVGYWFGDPRRSLPPAEAHAKTRAENDWTIAQVASSGGRLVAFCGVNPIADYAIDEMRRCAKLPHVKGMKVHFGNSGIDVRDAGHVERLKRFFAAANRERMPVVAHVRQRGTFERAHAQIIVDQVLPAAPDIVIQLAHMGVSTTHAPDDVAKVFVDAVASGDPRARNLYFDMAETVLTDGSQSAEVLAHIAATLRRIGLERVFFGTDMTTGGAPPVRVKWEAVRRLPLTDAELRVLAGNIPPYLR